MINLDKDSYEELIQIFKSYCPKAEIWAYGGRVKGEFHEGSDLDLTIKSFNEEGKSLSHLKMLLTESNIPIFVDINEFDALPDYFKKEILKLYERIF